MGVSRISQVSRTLLLLKLLDFLSLVVLTCD